MPVFAYQGVTADGRDVRGLVDAESARAARARLRRDGVFPTRVDEEAAARESGGPLPRLRRGASPTELALVTRQLGTLVGAGLPVVEALTAVGEQAAGTPLARPLTQVREAVTQGTALAEAMAAHGDVFPPLYVGMIRAGEAAGALDVVLERLANYTESQSRLRSKVRSALAYPILMTVLSGGILTFLLGFVVPRVTRIFADQHQRLPLPTRLLLGISGFVADFGWLLAVIVVFALLGFLAFLRRPDGRLRLDRILLRLPVAGPILTRISIARFARTLATLLASGIPLLSALDTAADVAGNEAVALAIREARTAIREGQSIAQPLRKSGLFPPLLLHMVAVGERSGELESMLAKVADAYEQDVESSIGTLTSLLEPLMIVVMGGVVLFIVLAILLPIFEINAMVR